MFHRRVIALGILSLLCDASFALAAPSYNIIDLGTLGGSSSWATAINNSGQVAGASAYSLSYSQHGFLYSSGTMMDMGTFGGPDSVASCINDNGVAAGIAMTNSETGYAFHAFRYQDGIMTDISGSSPYVSFRPQAINSNAQMAGYATEDGKYEAIRYSAGIWTNLGTLGGLSIATALNDDGQIVGYSRVAGDLNHAFLYTGSTMTDLGTLGGSESIAFAINCDGQVVGRSNTTSGPCHAFLYSQGTMIDIDMFGSSSSVANGINGEGQIVGCYSGTDGLNHGFLYQDGVMTDFLSLIDSNLGWTSMQGNAINDLGWIVGVGYNAQEQQHAFLMVPAPEPSTLVLLGAGVIALLANAWRRLRSERLEESGNKCKNFISLVHVHKFRSSVR